MNWTRKMLRYNARQELQHSLWKSVLVCFVGGLLVGNSSVLSNIRDLNNDGIFRRFDVLPSYNPFPTPDYLAIMIIFIIGLVVGIVWSLFISIPVKVGMCSYFIRAPYGDRRFSNIFSTYNSGRLLSVIGAMFYTGFIIFLWFMIAFVPFIAMSYFAVFNPNIIMSPLLMILFFVAIVPGIIKMYQYQMVPYILSESPGLRGKEAMRISREMTNGQKWGMFVLDLSFIGWGMLVLLPSLVATMIIITSFTFAPGSDVIRVVGMLATNFASLILLSYMEATHAQLYFAQREGHYYRTMHNQPGNWHQPQPEPSYSGYNTYDPPPNQPYPYPPQQNELYIPPEQNGYQPPSRSGNDDEKST